MIRLFILLLFCSLSVASLHAQRTPEAAYKRAIQYFNKGNDAKGYALLDKSLQLNPAHADALYARGYYHFRDASYAQAISDFDSLLARQPQKADAYRYRGLSHLYETNYQAAETDLLRAKTLDSTDSGMYADLGFFYYQVLDYETAQPYFNHSIAMQPNAFAYYYLAQTYYARMEYPQALQTLDKLLQTDPKYADAGRLKALIFLNTNKPADAAKMYEQLLQRGDIEEPDDFFNWGLAYYLQKNYRQALAYFTTPENHDDPDLYYYTGLAHYHLKNYPAALAAMNQAESLADTTDEATAPLLYDRALVQYQLKDRSSAAKDFLRSVALVPEIIGQRNESGDTLQLLANATLLLKGVYTPTQLNRARATGYRMRAGRLLQAEESQTEAWAFINQSLTLDSTQADSYFVRAKIEYAQQAYTEALRNVNRAIALRVTKANHADYYWRGVIYYEMDLPEKALTDYNKAISLNAQQAHYFYERAFASAALSEFPDAITDINRAISLNQEDANKLAYLLARAVFYNGNNQFDEALSDCNQILKTSPESAILYYQRGLAHNGLKQYNQAVTDFTQAIRLQPDFAEADEALQEVLRKQ